MPTTDASATEAGTATTDAHGGSPTRFEPIAVSPRYKPPRADVDPDTDKHWFLRVLPVLLANKLLFGAAFFCALLHMLVGVAVPAIVGFAINDLEDNVRMTEGAGEVPATDPSIYRTWFENAAELVGYGPGGDGLFSLSFMVGALLVIGALGALSMAMRSYGLYRVAYQIETDLRSIIYDKLTRLSFSFFDRIQSGQVISRANSDIRSVQMFLTFAPIMMLTFVSFALALVFMLTTHVGLTFASIFALPGVYFVSIRLRRVMFPLSWMVQSRMADVATIVDENINGVRVVKSFAAERREIGALAKAAQRLRWAAIEVVKVRARHAPLVENIARLGSAAMLLYGGWLVMQGHIEGVGTLITFNMYMMMLQAPFRVLGFFIMLSQRAAASAQRIYEILDEPIDIDDRPDAVDLTDPVGRVEFRDVTFGYANGPDVIRNLSFTIEPGETIAIVGETGCGKSTIARLLARFYDVTDGAVLVDGHDVRDLTIVSLRAQVGLLLDEPFLFSMSIRDNIAYGRPDAPMEQIVAAAKAAQAHEFIEKLEHGYDTVVGERGYTLSGGQRQRIAIARMFVVNPKVLVLDDATSAIDVNVEAKIHRGLKELMKGRTTIVIAHRMSTISLADRVMLMHDGRIAASGTHAELMRREPRYAAVLAREEQEQGEEASEPKAPGQVETDMAFRMRIRRQLVEARRSGEGDVPSGGDPIGGMG